MDVHHIGYLVKKINKAITNFEALGYKLQNDIVKDELRGVEICFMEKNGYIIELISPFTKDSVVSNLIKTYKNSPYHICYESRTFFDDIEKLEHSGYVRIDTPLPAVALGGRKVVFLFNPHIGIIEILERT